MKGRVQRTDVANDRQRLAATQWARFERINSTGGPSIYLKPGSINPTANNNGANWALSRGGFDGARNNTVTGVFNRIDTGSPGFVKTATARASYADAAAVLLAQEDEKA